MTTDQYAVDFRSILVGFAAACTAVTVLALVAPIRDSYLIAGLGAATAAVAGVLAFLARPPATSGH